MTNTSHLSLSKDLALNEISDLSQEINEKPTSLTWLPVREGGPEAFIALWGPIALEELAGDELVQVATGQDRSVDILVDGLGDPARSAAQGFPVYRISGGRGYLYSGNLDDHNNGHRHYAAIDATAVTRARAMSDLAAILRRDRTHADNDYSLWSEFAATTRRFALRTSSKAANELVDEVFSASKSKKFHSHVWSILPGGPIEHLGARQYWPVDIYAPKTEHPHVRSDIIAFLSTNSSDPFSEFLYYTLGDFEKAIAVNPASPIRSVLHYALGRKALEEPLKAALRSFKTKDAKWSGVSQAISFFNDNFDLYNRKPLVTIVPDFGNRVAAAEDHFKAVISDASASHADDAAYFLGWLAYHRGDSERALSYLSMAAVMGNGDYKSFALKQAIRVLEQYAPRDQLAKVEKDQLLQKEPAILYSITRSAYRRYDYAFAIQLAQQSLQRLNIDWRRLPATTDPGRINDALLKITASSEIDSNTAELPYLMQASREFVRFEESLKSLGTEGASSFSRRVREIVIKYSQLLDASDATDDNARPPPKLAHKDLRQAIHLLDTVMEKTPKDPQYSELREWAHYRRIRVLNGFDPAKVANAVQEMQREFPTSKLLDDVLAEEMYAEGVRLGDLPAARRTFEKLKTQPPASNAIDNGYSWMAIILRCEGKLTEANSINREIISRFPYTRHAEYARERLKTPNLKTCLFGEGKARSPEP